MTPLTHREKKLLQILRDAVGRAVYHGAHGVLDDAERRIYAPARRRLLVELRRSPYRHPEAK